MMLASLDLGDDGVIVAIAGQLVAQAQESAMRRRQRRAVVLGLAAEFAHLGLKVGDDRLPLVCAAPEDVAEPRGIGFIGGLAVAVDAVAGGGDGDRKGVVEGKRVLG